MSSVAKKSLKVTGSLLGKSGKLLMGAGSSIKKQFTVRDDIRSAAATARSQAKAGNISEAADLLADKQGQGWLERRILKKAEKSVIKSGSKIMLSRQSLDTGGDDDTINGISKLAQKGNSRAKKALGKYAGRLLRVGRISEAQGDGKTAFFNTMRANEVLAANPDVKVSRKERRFSEHLNAVFAKDIQGRDKELADEAAKSKRARWANIAAMRAARANAAAPKAELAAAPKAELLAAPKPDLTGAKIEPAAVKAAKTAKTAKTTRARTGSRTSRAQKAARAKVDFKADFVVDPSVAN